MSDTQSEEEVKPWSRSLPGRTGPRRGAGGLYRTAKGKDPASTGVPLNTANAAVVAAVRLAYEVAEAQIDRSTRLARRLREAGDQQVGPHSDEKALDAAERLVMKTLMSGLEWWEGSVAEGRCPVKRLAAAEYQMLGTILGFASAPRARNASADTPAPPAPAADSGAQRRQAPAKRALKVVLKIDPDKRRPVKVVEWDLARTGALQADVFFFATATGESAPFKAALAASADDAEVRLTILTPSTAAPARWNCAICDTAGEQVGYIDIQL